MTNWIDGRDDDADEASLRLEPEDVLEDDETGEDVLDVGYAPQDRPWAVDDWGTTAAEEEAGESLDGRLARELPDEAPPDDGDGLGDVVGTDGELRDDEVGNERAGRLRDRDDLADTGGSADDEAELVGWDAGIDGGGAAAEEAAVHVVPDN